MQVLLCQITWCRRIFFSICCHSSNSIIDPGYHVLVGLHVVSLMMNDLPSPAFFVVMTTAVNELTEYILLQYVVHLYRSS